MFQRAAKVRKLSGGRGVELSALLIDSVLLAGEEAEQEQEPLPARVPVAMEGCCGSGESFATVFSLEAEQNTSVWLRVTR